MGEIWKHSGNPDSGSTLFRNDLSQSPTNQLVLGRQEPDRVNRALHEMTHGGRL